jgi:hypothetical protein
LIRVSKKRSVPPVSCSHSSVSKSCLVSVSFTNTVTSLSVPVVVEVVNVVSVDVALAVSPVDSRILASATNDEVVLVWEDVVDMLLLVLTVDVSVRVVVPGTGPVTTAVVDVVPVTKMGWLIVVSVVAVVTGKGNR